MNSPNSSAVRSPYLDECAQITPLDFESKVCPKKPTLSLPGAGCGRGGTGAGSGHRQEQFWPAVRYWSAPESPAPGGALPYQIALNVEHSY